MEELQKQIRAVLNEVEEKLNNKDDVEFVKTKILELYEVFADELERLTAKWNDRLDIITAKYSLLESKMEMVESNINKIKEDIYVDDNEEYDLDITCPYCNAEFSIDVENELQDEVTCPECNNTIELDWNDDECGHDCSGCHHDCEHEDEDEDM